ncbi:MAG TPA: nitronate monooxygenase, partial [Acidimicrobiales bacterium]|nr:nitronate monooxygenase [Acidimicrobiales bacterium]
EPDPALVQVVHAGAGLAAWQVGSTDEARAALDAGCDLVVVQGFEAGGHVHGDRPLDELLAQVRAMTDRPIVAAGGIGTAARAAALLAAGADAVRIGTRFLASAEADVHPDYAAALVAASADDTVVTETFALGWPDAPHRVLRSSIEASDLSPAQRLPLPPGRSFDGDVGAAALYAGRSVDAVTGETTAAEIVAEFAAAFV